MTPDSYIRQAVHQGLIAVGVFSVDTVLPMSVSPTPDHFVEIRSQGRTRTAVTKQNYEWMGTVTLTLVKVNEKGYISSVELDDMDSKVCSVMDTLRILGFRVALTRFLSSDSDQVETPTETIGRRNIRYEIWVNRITL